MTIRDKMSLKLINLIKHFVVILVSVAVSKIIIFIVQWTQSERLAFALFPKRTYVY